MASFRALLALSAPLFLTQPAASQPFFWSSWSQDSFGRAKAEKRLVLLDLEAVWCHWCHVMEAVTYADPKVAVLIGDHFVAIRADQDASPELSSRYSDWGWPATIILAADGTELAKLRGFIEPVKLAALLKAFVDDPTPGPSAFSIEDVAPAPDGLLGAPARAAMKETVERSFDSAHGGWGRGHRYIDADSLDLALIQAEMGDADAAARARKTLDAARALIDPVWGGVYQYSDKDDWSSPHFEKLMAFQAQYLRQYSQAFSRWRDPADLAAATAIKTYMAAFLRDPQGGFYVSQDADLDAQTDGHAFYALDDSGPAPGRPADRQGDLCQRQRRRDQRTRGLLRRRRRRASARHGRGSSPMDQGSSRDRRRRLQPFRTGVRRPFPCGQSGDGTGLHRPLRRHRRTELDAGRRRDRAFHRRPF